MKPGAGGTLATGSPESMACHCHLAQYVRRPSTVDRLVVFCATAMDRHSCLQTRPSAELPPCHLCPLTNSTPIYPAALAGITSRPVPIDRAAVRAHKGGGQTLDAPPRPSAWVLESLTAAGYPCAGMLQAYYHSISRFPNPVTVERGDAPPRQRAPDVRHCSPTGYRDYREGARYRLNQSRMRSARSWRKLGRVNVWY